MVQIMGDLETETLKRLPIPYVGGNAIWMTLEMREEFEDEFTSLINSLNQNIKFTSEEEKDNSLTFLDTLTIHCPDGHISAVFAWETFIVVKAFTLL